jgi:hypothetical protein
MSLEDLEKTLTWQIAYTAALESLLLAMFDRLSQNVRKEIRDSFLADEEANANSMFFDTFTDEQLDMFKEAHQRVHSIIRSRPESG